MKTKIFFFSSRRRISWSEERQGIQLISVPYKPHPKLEDFYASLCSLPKVAGVLTCDESIRSRLLFSPCRDKHCNVTMTSLQEPIYSQLDALTGEHFLVTMTVERQQKEKMQLVMQSKQRGCPTTIFKMLYYPLFILILFVKAQKTVWNYSQTPNQLVGKWVDNWEPNSALPGTAPRTEAHKSEWINPMNSSKINHWVISNRVIRTKHTYLHVKPEYSFVICLCGCCFGSCSELLTMARYCPRHLTMAILS